MHVYFAGEQLYQYPGYSETQPSPLANDVASIDVLKQVVNAQCPRYNQVSSNLLPLLLLLLNSPVFVGLSPWCLKW